MDYINALIPEPRIRQGDVVYFEQRYPNSQVTDSRPFRHTEARLYTLGALKDKGFDNFCFHGENRIKFNSESDAVLVMLLFK